MVHKYFLIGYYIALDTNSGAVHILDKLAYDLLDFIDEDNFPPQCPEKILRHFGPEHGDDAVNEAYDELYELYKGGMLFSKDDYVDIEKLSLEHSPIKALCLHIAHDCNLRCEYCFASTGDFKQGRSLMPFEVGKKAIDFLIEKSQGRRNLEVDFFGGEPTLNFNVVKQIIEYARSIEKDAGKAFRFTLTTNGLLLSDENIEFINSNMDNVVLSIDGRKQVNDRVRKRVDGRGIYDDIVPKFLKIANLRNQDRYYVRGTFTRYNLDFASDVLHLADLGFEQISVEPVVAKQNEPYSIRECDLPAIFAEYERLAAAILERKKQGRGFNFFHFMIDLEQGPCAIKRIRGCGAGNEYVAITPEGDIYPCHQFVGVDKMKIGNVLTGKFDGQLKRRFGRCNVYTKPECRGCFAKFYCSGGCHANNYQFNGDIEKCYKIGCEMEKKRVECAIMLKAAQALEGDMNG